MHTNKRIVKRVSLIMCFVMVFSLIPWHLTYAEAEPEGQKANQEELFEENVKDQSEPEDPPEPVKSPDPVTEDVTEENAVKEESTLDSTTFDLGDNEKMLVMYGQDVRFEDKDGDLVDYDPELVRIKYHETEQGRSLTKYAYENRVSDHKAYMPEALSEETPVLMEKDDMSVEMTPITENILSDAVSAKDISVSGYEEVEEKDLKVSYEDEEKGVTYTYTSQNDGIKEDIVLREKPEENILAFRLKLTGLTPVKTEEGGIILLDEDNKETAYIESPFMNDASGDAYSEDIDLDIEETENSNEYLLTMNISRKYLNAKDRIYPVTIDPSVTWRKSGDAANTYVNSQSPDTNYHSSSIKKLGVGRGTKGLYRSYLKFLPLQGKVKGKYVTAARLVVYETSNSNSGRTVGAYGVKASWKVNTITWNNRAGFYAAVLGTARTNGVAGHAVSLTVTDWARDIANESKTNYGLMLKNTTEPTSSYAEFFATTHTVSARRPKLVVSYTDGPTKASSVSAEKTYVKRNNTIRVNWTGIKSTGLAHIQYRVAKLDPDTGAVINDSYVAYTNFSSSHTASSGTNVAIPNSSSFPEGKYRIYIRGVDNGGIKGSGVGTNVYVDGTAPEIEAFEIDPETDEAEYKGVRTPELSWEISEKYLSDVKVYVDGNEAGSLAALDTDSYVLPSGTIRTSGIHTIHITATDKAGNTVSTQDENYYLDIDPPVIGTLTSSPATVFNNMSDNETPVISWSITDNDLETVTIYKYDNGEYDEIYDAGSSDLSSGTYTVQQGGLTEGRNMFKLEAEDSGGNRSFRTLAYYLDTIAPQAEMLEITPGTGFFNSSGVLTPVISWSYIDQAISSVKYSMDGISYFDMGASKVGSFTLPGSCFSNGAGTYTIYVKAVDTAENESAVSTLTYVLANITENDLIPYDIAAAEYYGKNVITWNADGYCPSLGKVKVYRGTTANFSISDGILIEENADNGMYIDNYVGTGDTYYRLVVVSEVSDHHVISQSDAIRGVSMLRASDLTNRTGSKEYLRYHEFNTPSGSGTVELSSGNMRYTETDYEISNGKQDYGLSRSYNSFDARTTAFGAGVSDSYHKELYKDNQGNIYYVDENGSACKFILSNNAYSLEEGKDLTLTVIQDGYEIEDKAHNVIRFDEAGRAVSESEPNGIEITYLYDSRGRLERVKSKADTAGDREIRIHYENDSMLIKSIDLPDDTIMKYSYANGRLTAVSHIRNTDLVAVPYVKYGYNSDLLTTIEDALENEYDITYTNGKVTRITDPINEKDDISYGNTVTVTHRTSSGASFSETEYSLDSATGKVLWEEDANGNRTSYEYTQANDLLVKKVKAKTGWEEVDGNGNISVHSQDNVTETEYTYNGNEDITVEESSDGTSTVTTYDQDGNISREKEYSEDNLTSDTEYEYDEYGNEVEAEEHVADTLDLTEYDDDGNETEEEEQEEGITTDVTESQYDDYGNALETTSVSGMVENEERSTYDAMGRTLKEITDSTVTEYTYDVFGRVIQTDITRNSHTSHTYTAYNDNGEVVSETDERGNVTTYMYDDSGRKVYTNSPASGITAVIYSYAENVTIKDGLSGKTYPVLKVETEKDADNNVLAVRYTDKAGEIVREKTGTTYTDHTYDDSGNDIIDVVWSDNSQDESISISLFNEKGQRFKEIRKPVISGGAFSIGADSVVNTTTFTDTGDTDSEEDALGNVKRYEYDEQGRVTDIYTGTGNESSHDMNISYSVTDTGSSTLMTDGNGNQRKDSKNHAGLTVLSEDMGLDGEQLRLSSGYDSKGRKMTDVYADGSRILYSYDQYDRLTGKTCVDQYGAEESITSYTYTQYGEVASVTHAPVNSLTVTTAYQYDTLGRKTKETSTYGNDTSAVTEYVYDSKGRLSTLKYPSQTNGISGLVYEYDALGKPVRIRRYQTNDTVREYAYGPFDRIEYTRDYVIGTGSFLKTSYGYDDLGRIISKTVTKNGTNTIVESYEVTYDKLDRIIELTRVLNNSDDPIDETRYYEYDDHGRLSRSGVLDNYDEPDEDETIEDLIQYTAYEYDAAGNRIQINDRSGETTFTYNGVNQLIYQDAPEKEVEYIYDLRGNQTEASNVTDGVITRNDYAVEGQLVRVSEEDANGTTVIQQNAYDAEGTRVQKTEGNDIKKYYYAGSDMIATTENGNAVFTGIYDGGDIVGAYLGSTPTYDLYCTDVQGSTSVISASDLSIAGGYSYSDYGEVSEMNGTPTCNEICYTGAVYDRTTGEHYLRARYYDPEQGVFATQDTLRGEATDCSLWNSYAYCNGDPVNNYDPSGHKKKPIYDISNKLDSSMKTNLRWLLRRWLRASNKKDLCKKIKRMIRVYRRFYKLVKTGGKWDLKYQWNTRLTSLTKQIVYHGEKIDYDDPGNIHFGFVGCVLFRQKTLIAGAGIYQMKTDYHNIKAIRERINEFVKKKNKKALVLRRLHSFGDDPRDTKRIKQGYEKGMIYKRAVIDKWMKKGINTFNIKL